MGADILFNLLDFYLLSIISTDSEEKNRFLLYSVQLYEEFITNVFHKDNSPQAKFNTKYLYLKC